MEYWSIGVLEYWKDASFPFIRFDLNVLNDWNDLNGEFYER